jgi:hypothetical protein
MGWTRYKLVLLLYAAVVVGGVSVSITEFNYRVRPEVPLYAFKLENHGYGFYQVDFLGERVNFTLPLDQATQYIDSEKIRGYGEQAADILSDSSRRLKDFLSEMSVKLNQGKETLRDNLIYYISNWKEYIQLK